MDLEQFARDDERLVRRYDYDAESILAVDFGPAGPEASVDVVDGTVIVVTDDDQYEFDLPEHATDAHTFIRNGVLTLELEVDA